MSKLFIFFTFIALAFGVFANGSENDTLGIYEIKIGDFSIKVTNFGARIVSVIVPDKNGKLDDIVLGFDTAQDYQESKNNYGAIVGRVANRISGAKFTLNGTVYKLIPNDGNGTNTIHGGPKGFAQVAWKVDKIVKNCKSPYITLTYNSSDGDQGFPGAVIASVTYQLKKPYTLIVKMCAKALNKATPINLAQHTFWNIRGHNTGNILSHELRLFASYITEQDEKQIPTGKLLPVKNTAYDFLKLREINEQMEKLPNSSKGYDINYVVDDGLKHEMKPVAVVYDEKSGRIMRLSANMPGVQLFTANSAKNVTGKGGFVYQTHAALCLETQGFPDSVNQPDFPSQIVYPGGVYDHRMVFTFSTKK
ncbi:hypothetical protein CASFOL_032981 [Castilleja foliolosa]|uniref:Aldose 1-epimerase n=1 Tax=Castilleja foliolosa TaxID=1961234 RepID=A0ABD3C312_9LAMI